MRTLLTLIVIHFALHSHSTSDTRDDSNYKDITIFLTTNKSGSNWISASLSAITRKPIAWLYQGDKNDEDRPSYNRLDLPLASKAPLLYRTHHDFSLIKSISQKKNKLIFVTRNPKELLFRKYSPQFPDSEDPDVQFIKSFLNDYLHAFNVYYSWFPETKRIVFYEDFISNQDEILLQLLQFIGEEPTYLDDYLSNKDEYMNNLLESYQQQHVSNLGGASSVGGPKAILYSQNARIETLQFIDEYIKKMAPQIWEEYLYRFQVSEND